MTTGRSYLKCIGGDPAEIAQIRRDVKAIALTSGFSDRADDIALALDELLANAQEHGSTPIDVEVWSDGRLILEVFDRGGGFSRPEIWNNHPPPKSGQRGRGLWIVRQLSDRVEISSGFAGTRVHLEFTVDPGIGA